MVNTNREKIKSLLIKGFSKKEVAKILKIKEEDIKENKNEDINQESIELYSELQKDLAKLSLSELSKENRDVGSILNAIKLQAELQEKKLILTKNLLTLGKINKSYIYDRDEDISKMAEKGVDYIEIAKKYNISVLSVKQAIDRINLKLPEELKELNPTIISETKGLDKKMRLNILEDAYKNKLTRKEVRNIVIKLKNESR